MKYAFRISAIAVVAAFSLASGVGAEGKSDKPHGKKPLQKIEQKHARKEIREHEGVGERREIRERVEQQAAGPKDCPPGLAKKENGCLPPGQAKKLYGSQSAAPYTGRYRIGERFDESEPYFILRRNEYDRYGVPPFEGQYYVRTENELLRLDRKTNAVIDIITGVNELLNN